MASDRLAGMAVFGWREWVGLPNLGIKSIKAKVDTGARSSSLHAYDIKEFQRDSKQWVRFKVHPVQRNNNQVVEAEAPVLAFRSVRSSSGKASLRPVIVTNVQWLDSTWSVELTLANRDAMGFRMLLGREAFRGRFLVDTSASYYGGKPKRRRRLKKKC